VSDRFQRRHRNPDGRRPVLAGGFPGDDRDITEVLGPHRGAIYDGATFQWEGASGAGLPDGRLYPRTPYPPYPDPDPAPAPSGRLRVQPPGPDMFPALREPPAPPAAPVGYEIIGRETAKGWPRLGELRCDYPAALAETPIPCDSVHRDPAATTFYGLRLSAQAAGWHMDRLGQWVCPRCCQVNPEYRGLYPVTFYDIQAAEAYVAGDLRGENRERARAELGARVRTLLHHDNSHQRGRHADELEVTR